MTTTATPIDIAIPARRQASLWGDAWRRLRRNEMAVAGGIVVVIIVLIALFGPMLVTDPTRQDMLALYEAPSAAHPFGTDNLGRDQMARLVYGARVAVAVGVFTQLLILLIGLPIGSVAALMGGRVDNALMRITDIVYAFPDRRRGT